MNKFIVIKRSEAAEVATFAQESALYDLQRAIAQHRAANDKTIIRRYAVVNLDEPYAAEIIEIMRRNGHWEDDEDFTPPHSPVQHGKTAARRTGCHEPKIRT